MSLNFAHIDAGMLIRRSLFLLVLLILAFGNIFVLFQGLNSPTAMDQAQISREIARGNGISTKFIRPIAYHQAQTAAGRPIAFEGFQDTYHAPLNLLVNAAVLKVVGGDDGTAWALREKEMIFPLDRVIAAVSTIFFLLAIGVNYLLVSRIFDVKIASVTAILMLFCEAMWSFSLSGLPQMLMMLLFSCALYFAYRADEAASEGGLAMVPAVIAGIFLTLLALTHWMTVWLALGYITYVAIAIRPRGLVAAAILFLLIVAALWPVMRNNSVSGMPLGTAYLTLYSGLGASSEEAIMRSASLDDAPPIVDGILGKVLRTSLLQLTDIVPFLGGIVVAPLFFLCLLHPFKRASIANFRWAILLMFIGNSLALAFFGISRNPLDPNQLHIIFAPIMTAYGLAFISILWSRLDVVLATPMLRNVHFFIIIFICALPLILSLPQKVRVGMHLRDRGGVPHWPPYFAPALATGLKSVVDEKQIIYSDQPWAVAWYADRMSIWLPPTRGGFESLERIASDLRTPVHGILITPSSHGAGPVSSVMANHRDFASLVLDGKVSQATSMSPDPRAGTPVFNRDPKIESIMRRYSQRTFLMGIGDMAYYSERPLGSR
ncbi:MAG: hypothetical protein ACNA8L_02805 [Luteolibacter sp.]|jgi:hypothetical protein